ncbi:MAG: AI-2E family transporter [Propionibacteriaceae bacterium]|jgi:predicted PurR-regulated permease PerM|nr:AI-2E family transporter [Propionibacteriaceae bacterium]
MAHPEAPADTTTPDRRPLMSRGLSLLVGSAALLITAQSAREISSTLASAFMALNLVIVVWPIQRFLARHIPKALASIVAGVVAIGVLVGLLGSLGWTITLLIKELPHYSGPFNQLISNVLDWVSRMGIDTSSFGWKDLAEQAKGSVGTIVSFLSGFASSLSSAVGLILLVAIILVFMILDSVGFSERMQRLGERHNPTLAWALTSFAAGTRRYWVVATVFGLIVALCDWVLLISLGVPLALAWAVLSFVTNYIPNIGFLLGLIPPVVMALLATDPWTTVWVIIGYCVLNVVIQTIIQPKFTGDAVGITSTVAILSLLVWAYILGPLGALLAIPATLLVKTLFIDIDPQARWLNAFIASNPTTSDQDPIRLSNLLIRAKRIRKLTAKAASPSSTPEEAADATCEIATIEAEAGAEGISQADIAQHLDT